MCKAKSYPLSVLLCFILAVGLCGLTFAAGPKTEVQTIEGGDILMLQEVGAGLLVKDGKIEVLFVTPAEQRSEGYRTVDLQEGDQLLMLNGKKVTAITDAQEVYDLIDIGADVKLGIVRDKSMQIVSFKKAEPGSLPGEKMMVMSMSVGEDAEDGEAVTQTFTSGGGGAEEALMLFDAGLILGETDGVLQVAMVMPDAKDKITGEMPEAGDVIVSMQGKTIGRRAPCAEIYEGVDFDDTVTLEFKRGDKIHSLSFVRSNEKPKIMIKKK